MSVDEVAPLSQISGLNLTNLTILGLSDQMNINIYPDIQPGPVGLVIYRTELYCHKIQNYKYRPALYHSDMNWVVSFLPLQSPPPQRCENMFMHVRCSWRSLLTPNMTLIMDQSTCN